MYKVLIVDDEKEIRDGLAVWPWEERGLQLDGCCAHGLEALQRMSEHPVDLLLTDIRMPFMDGIELMENVRREYPFTQIVIVSGYGDFEYAQKAVRYGAADYLLKPIHFPSLDKMLERLVAELNAKKQAEYRLSVLKRKEERFTKILREQFLCRLFQTPLDAEDIEHEGSAGEVSLQGDSFTVAAFRPDRIAGLKPEVPERVLRLHTFSIDNILNDLWDAKEPGYHLVDQETAAFFVLSRKPEPLESFRELHQSLMKYTGLFKSGFSAGIGRTVSLPSEIYRSAHSALQALRNNREPFSVSLCAESEETEPAAPAPVAPPALYVVNADHRRDNIILTEARRYIRDHYDSSITLKDAADHVYVSPGHLSALFKETGETFLKFLTSIRMKKAVELLDNSSYKVYEIVERVGYSDPAYFSEVFKKFTGKSPNEYRGKMRSVREEC